MILTGANLEAAAMWDALIRRALTDTTEDLEYQQVHDSLLHGCLPYGWSAHEPVVLVAKSIEGVIRWIGCGAEGRS